MISINATLFIQIIHFIILVFILNRLMLRPIIKLIDERSKYIEDAKKEVTRIEEETAELTRKYNTLENNARKGAWNENAELKQEILREAEKIFDETRNEIATVKNKNAREIEEQLKLAKQVISHEAKILADDITELVIGRRVRN